MKKILIILSIFVSLYAQAQNNQLELKTGILYSNTQPSKNLHLFGQKSTPDTTSFSYFKQVYFELLRVSSDRKGMMTMENLYDWIRFKTEKQIVPIGMLHYRMAYQRNLKTEKNLDVFMASLLTEKPLVVGKPISVEFSKELFLTNQTATITSLEADFGEGTKHTFKIGSQYELVYTATGNKNIRFVAKFNNGVAKTFLARIEVINAQTIASRTTFIAPCFVREGTNRIKATIPFNPYEPETFGGTPSEVELGYYYATAKGCSGQQSLTKPILIMDGFDPEDTRTISEIYTNKLAYDGVNAKLAIQLRDMGYDVIIANFPVYQIGTGGNGNPIYRDGGSDYIERNAMGIVEVIKTLNQELQASQSTEQLIVVGPSMGGLISRYALSYMEKNNMNHNTKLWVSFDSPHNGANIPIGAQRFLRFYGETVGIESAANSLRIQLNNPAAKQMLLHHHTTNTALPTSTSFRTQFLINQNNNGIYGSNGFPTKPRRIALVNGSGDGDRYGVAGEEVFQIRGYIASPYGNLQEVTKSSIRFSGNYGVAKNSFGGYYLNQSDYINTNASSNSISYDIAPGGWYNTIGIINRQTPQGTGVLTPTIIGWVLADIGIVQNTETDINNNIHCFIPTKSALAFRGTNQDLGEAINNRDLVCTGETPFEAYYAPNENQDHVSLTQASVEWLLGQFNTIPTPVLVCGSHQNFTLTRCASNTENITVKTSFNLSKGLYNNGVVPIKAIEAGDGFVEFWRGDVRLQRYEVRAIVPKVSDISGPVSVCNTPATFTLNNLPSGVTATWQASTNLSPSSGSGTIATVSSVGTGEAWIEYTIGGCGQKLRHYVNSLSRVEMEGSKYICSPSTRQYSVPLYTGATYTWTSTPNVTITNIAPNIVNVTGLTNGQGWVRVNIALSSACLTESRLIHKAIWVGLPTAPIITQPTGVTPIAPNTYEFTYYKTLNNLTYTLRFNSGGSDRIVYTVDNPSLYPFMPTPDLPVGWFELGGSPNNSLSFIPNRMDEGTYTFTLMGQNDCNNNPFAETAPKTTVIINVGSLAARQLSTTNLNVYPNPTQNELFIQNQGKNTFELYNKYNQLLLSGEFLDKHIVHLRKLPQDVYFLHIIDEKGNKTQTKIVVQK